MLFRSRKYYLQMWKFSLQHPRWTVSTKELPLIGSISPACTRLVTYSGSPGNVHVWNAYNGRFLTLKRVDGPYFLPRLLNITFDSEDRFYCNYNTHREPYVINALSRGPATHSITHCEKQRLEGRAGEKHCHLDDGREWVFCGSHRICWVPPGYIGSTPASHWWVGSSLVLVGQDGMLRKLTFLEPSL